MNLENPFSKQESKKINYENLLSSIVEGNGRLSVVANKLLERKDLLAITPATFDNSLNAYGVNSIGETSGKGIDIRGIRINPERMTEEVAVHELIHFFSMPALKGGFDAEQDTNLESLSENVKQYWLKTKALWNYAKQNNYEAINSHSQVDDVVEFAVNFTNEQSEEKLKELNIYEPLVNTFFDYYNSIGIREDNS